MLLSVCLALGLCACGSKAETAPVEEAPVEQAPTWQEQYDLGVRYLSEGNYEEAIIAFTAAIKIDPKRPEAYIGRGDAHEKMDNLEQAMADYQAALELGANADAEAKLKEWESALLAAQLQEELWPEVCDLDLPMTVDSVVLGETSIETAKATYVSYPYAMSNLMNDDTEDTVYNCFGMNDMPVPAGHVEMQFGFLFAAPVGGAVNYITVNQPGLTVFGGLQIGDSPESVLAFFGFPETPPHAPLQWTLNNGAQLHYAWHGGDDFMFVYQMNGQKAVILAEYGMLNSLTLSMEGV